MRARPLTLVIICTLASWLAGAGACRAEVRLEPLTYRHGDLELVGSLAYDDALPGRRPGVVVVHEWWGLGEHPRERARRLAGLGYVALAVDMYGGGQVTTDRAVAQKLAGGLRGDPGLLRARAAAGYEALRAHPRVDPERIAAIGFCFGGTVALQMAYAGLPLRGVVSFHGNPTPPGEGDAVRARVLVCHGADDPHVQAATIEAFKQAMRERRIDWQWIDYGGAVHSFTNPAADGSLPGACYDAAADRRSWEHMRQFLAEVLAEDGSAR